MLLSDTTEPSSIFSPNHDILFRRLNWIDENVLNMPHYNLVILKIRDPFYIESVINQKPRFQTMLNNRIYHA